MVCWLTISLKIDNKLTPFWGYKAAKSSIPKQKERSAFYWWIKIAVFINSVCCDAVWSDYPLQWYAYSIMNKDFSAEIDVKGAVLLTISNSGSSTVDDMRPYRRCVDSLNLIEKAQSSIKSSW